MPKVNVDRSILALRQLGSGDAAALAVFFAACVANGDSEFFEPHPLTAVEAERLSHYEGSDVYVIVEDRGSVVGYGLLRGWDEGFEVPSLGISIHPAARGLQLGRLLMHYLHAIALQRGANRVRLRVKVGNERARRLYESLGYRFSQPSGGYDVGWIELNSRRATLSDLGREFR